MPRCWKVGRPRKRNVQLAMRNPSLTQNPLSSVYQNGEWNAEERTSGGRGDDLSKGQRTCSLRGRPRRPLFLPPIDAWHPRKVQSPVVAIRAWLLPVLLWHFMLLVGRTHPSGSTPCAHHQIVHWLGLLSVSRYKRRSGLPMQIDTPDLEALAVTSSGPSPFIDQMATSCACATSHYWTLSTCSDHAAGSLRTNREVVHPWSVV